MATGVTNTATNATMMMGAMDADGNKCPKMDAMNASARQTWFDYGCANRASEHSMQVTQI